jgi:hypothetical protein
LSAYWSNAGPAGWSRTSFLGNIKPRNDFICSFNLLCDGVNGGTLSVVRGLRVGVVGVVVGVGLQCGVRYGVSCLHGDRGGSLLGFARCVALNV